MAENPLLSVIIPIYNVERYLRECIQSILSQSYSNFEIILVDDGSPDNSAVICDEFARLDKRISVIHKKNGGLSDARNVGFDAARGEYVAFLDADDIWCNIDGALFISRCIYKYHPDIIKFGVEVFNPTTNRTIAKGFFDEDLYNSLSANDAVNRMSKCGDYPGAAWSMAIRRSFIKKHNISFVKGVTGEDFDWIAKVLYNATSIKFINKRIYRYTSNVSGSITSKPRLSGILGIHNAISNWLAISDERYIGITESLCRAYIQGLMSFVVLTNEEKKKAKSIVTEDAAILRSSHKVSSQIMWYTIHLLGVTPVGNLLSKIYRFKLRLKERLK